MELVQIYLKKSNEITIKKFPSWIRIRILNADPDPGGKLNADPSGSGYNLY